MRALISGAGIAGLTAAQRLAAAGAEVVIAEANGGPRDEGYMIDFFGPGLDAAERLGLLGEIERIHYPIEELVYVDGRGERVFEISYPALRRRLFAGRHFNFLRGDLERLLRGHVERRARIRWATTVAALDQDRGGVDAELSDGSAERFDVVIGADGVHSRVRELAFGPEPRFEHSLEHVTAAFVIEAVPDGVPQGGFTMLTAPGRMVAVYPIGGGRAATFLVHRSARARPHLDPKAELRAVYGDLGWVVPDLLAALEGADLYHDRVSQIRIERWTSGRVAVCGDAAWCVSLMAGQGASLALAGGASLAAALAPARAEVAAALVGWERDLRPGVERRQKAGARTAAWFVPETGWRMQLRDLVIRTSTLPLLAQLARRQMGIGRPGT